MPKPEKVQREQPQWLFDQITKAVRSAQSLHLSFRDHRGYSWRFSLVLITKEKI